MFLISGHGLAGALLAHALLQRGAQVTVFDPGNINASGVASGILNPVTGKRVTRAWHLATFLPAALKTYRAIQSLSPALPEKEERQPLVRELSALWLHATPEDAALFALRAEADPELFEAAVNPQPYERFFHLREAPGRIYPVYSIDVAQLLHILRERLRTLGALVEEPFNLAELEQTDGGLRYRDLQASHVIFCEGAAAVTNPHFQNLPWSPAAGEALTLSIPGLPRDAVYKLGHGLSLSPWPPPNPSPSPEGTGDRIEQPGEINSATDAQPSLTPAVTPPPSGEGPGVGAAWWLGSNYLWDTLKPAPTAAFRAGCEVQLKAWLTLPYEITDHRAGVRPATVDRKPFIGLHPAHPRIGLFNGLGAKGVLMAPYLAENLAAHLTDGTLLMPEADVARHRRALSR